MPGIEGFFSGEDAPQAPAFFSCAAAEVSTSQRKPEKLCIFSGNLTSLNLRSFPLSL